MPIEALLKSADSKAAITGLLSGAAGGAIAGSLTRNKTAKKLLKTGGLMAVGGLALKAWQVHSAKNQPEPEAYQNPAPLTNQEPIPNSTAIVQAPSPNLGQSETAMMTQFMIAAAHADGILTSEEQNKIWQQAVQSGIPADELALLSDALSQPMEIDQLIGLPANMEEKIEAYTAAAIVIEEGCDAGEQFLTQLGSELQLPTGLTQALLSQLR